MTTVSICIDVSDLEQATVFYTQVLGCCVKSEKETHAELTVENSTIYLLEKPENSNALIEGVDSRRYKRHWTPVHLDFHLSDIEKAKNLLSEYGGSLEGEEKGDWGAVAYCSDPFGNGFCILNIN